MPSRPPMDEEIEAVTRVALQKTLEQLLVVLEGLKDLKEAADLELRATTKPQRRDSRPDAKIIPFPRSPRKS